MTFDLAVVGAGIVGLGAAFAAVERGWRVVVVERATEVAGASVRNFGHIGVGAHAGAAREYAHRSRELWLTLASRAGFWLRESGALVVARSADEIAVLHEVGLERILSRDEVHQHAPVVGAFGGAWLTDDLQVDPRRAAPAIARYLESVGVEFRWRTAALGAEPGVLLTARGAIAAERIVFAIGHDLDHVYPEIAELSGVERCGLDMLLTDGVGLEAPLLTGTSMLRYSAFAEAPSLAAVRAEYEREDPDLFAFDINQMYTERPDGTLLVGDTHEVGLAIAPFQREKAFDALRRLGEQLFGTPLRVRQRWQGAYAKGPGEFLAAMPGDGIRTITVTTGSGMTCGLALAESVIAEL